MRALLVLVMLAGTAAADPLAKECTSVVTLAFDATIANQYETIHLAARAAGPVTTTVQTFDCAPQGNSKKATPDACN